MRILAASAFWLVLLAMVGTMFVPVLFGYERYVIAGHSMTGTIPYGSVVYSEQVPGSAVRRGDVVTIVPPYDEEGKPVTHRVIKVGSIVNQQRKRVTVYTLKGDANRSEDPGPITLDKAAAYRFHVPVVGLLFIYADRFGFFLIGLPALLLGVLPIVRLWREAGETDAMAVAIKRAGPTGYEGIRRLSDVL